MTPTDAPADSTQDADPGWRAAWPFFVAVGVVVVVLGIVGLFHVIRPGSERLTDSAQVQHAINDHYTAKNALTYQKFRDTTCSADVSRPGFPDAAVFGRQARQSRDEHGPITVTEITDVAVTGSSATANMRWHYTKRPQDEVQPISLVKQGDNWTLCGVTTP